MLTPKQHELLMFIDGYQRRAGFCPTFKEMATALRLKSNGGIDRMLGALVEAGYVRRTRYRRRAIEVLKVPASDPADSLQLTVLPSMTDAAILDRVHAWRQSRLETAARAA